MRRQTAEQRALEQEYLAGEISEQEYRHALRQIQRERAQAPRPHDVAESRGNIPTPTRIPGPPLPLPRPLAMRPKAKLERAVVYARREDGTLDIKLRHPWDGKRRLEAFPWRIQLKVQGEHYFMATPEESSKLWTARFISDELHAAVWDDIMCVRATEALAHEARTDRAVARDIQHLFADFADPTTLQRLDARFKERGR